MKLGETLAKTVGKLERTEQEGAGAGQRMGQQIPSEGMVMLPDGIGPVNQETFVVAENISHHQANECKE
jgi:hypothetical protein